MKIKSLMMILKMGAEEQTEMIKMSMQQMRKILAEKPEMKDKVKASLLQRGIPVEHIDDPVELVAVAEAKMQGIQDETKAELLKDAEEAGLSPDDFLEKQMASLNMRAQEFQGMYGSGGGGGHGHGHDGGHGHSHGGEPCHGHGAPPQQQQQQQQHGHGHGGHSGHGQQQPQQGGHGHSHNGEPCHGHGDGGAPAQPTGPLRFPVGGKVKCNMGADNGWHSGTVVAQNYAEVHWPEGQRAAYQVQLDSGQLIFAPYDRGDIIESA